MFVLLNSLSLNLFENFNSLNWYLTKTFSFSLSKSWSKTINIKSLTP